MRIACAVCGWSTEAGAAVRKCPPCGALLDAAPPAGPADPPIALPPATRGEPPRPAEPPAEPADDGPDLDELLKQLAGRGVKLESYPSTHDANRGPARWWLPTDADAGLKLSARND